jgi:hypothetical protein
VVLLVLVPILILSIVLVEIERSAMPAARRPLAFGALALQLLRYLPVHKPPLRPRVSLLLCRLGLFGIGWLWRLVALEDGECLKVGAVAMELATQPYAD